MLMIINIELTSTNFFKKKTLTRGVYCALITLPHFKKNLR